MVNEPQTETSNEALRPDLVQLIDDEATDFKNALKADIRLIMDRGVIRSPIQVLQEAKANYIRRESKRYWQQELALIFGSVSIGAAIPHFLDNISTGTVSIAYALVALLGFALVSFGLYRS